MKEKVPGIQATIIATLVSRMLKIVASQVVQNRSVEVRRRMR